MSIDYERVILDELRSWPGVVASFSHRSKHRQVTFSLGDRSRFIIIPDTPGDSQRGHLNSIADARKELRALGARRSLKEPVAHPRAPKRRNRPDREMRIERAPVKPNPFDVLASVTFAAPEPVRLSWWQRFKARWLAPPRPSDCTNGGR